MNIETKFGRPQTETYQAEGEGMRMRRLGGLLTVAVLLVAVNTHAQLGNSLHLYNGRDDEGYGRQLIGAIWFDFPGDTTEDGISYRWACAYEPWSMDTLMFQPACNCPLPIKRIRIFRGAEDVLLVDRFPPEDSVRWNMDESGDHILRLADSALVVDHTYTEPEWFSISVPFWYIPPESIRAQSSDSMEIVFSYIPPYQHVSEVDTAGRQGFLQAPIPGPAGGGAGSSSYHLLTIDGALATTGKGTPPASLRSCEAGLAPGVYVYRHNGMSRATAAGMTIVR